MIDTAETIVRWAGAVGFALALAIAGWGAARGLSLRAGRASGLAPRIGALPAYLLLAIPYFAVWVVLWRLLPMSLSVPARWVVLVLGTLLGIAALTLYVGGRLALGRMYNVSSGLGTELYPDHRLVIRGPYRRVRHPMYLGLILGALAALLVYRTWTTVFILACLPGAVFKANREDRLLADEFGPAFEEYRGRVPGWVPRLHPRATEARGLPARRNLRPIEGGG